MEEIARSRKTLWITLLVVFLINFGCYLSSSQSPFSTIQKRADASGFSHGKAREFFYFYYYTGHFPLATLNKELDFSKQGAEKEIEERGGDLIMEFLHWSRLGEYARIWAYLPNAWLTGTAENPTITLFNGIMLTISLLVLIFGFWKAALYWQGLLLYFAIQFTPYFLYETYSRENIFALLGVAFFFSLGLLLPLLNGKVRGKRILLYVILSVCFTAFITELRNEYSVVLMSILIMSLFIPHISWIKKAALIGLSILCFWSVKQLIRTYFDHKWEETEQLVEEREGHVYNGDKIDGHRVWHMVFCGLGDFDDKYGYVWDDRVAYAFAVPILNERFNMGLKYSGKYHLDQYYDESKLYYIKFDEIQEYEDLMKEKVTTDIANDPVWYAEILVKRLERLFNRTLPIPWLGWILIPVFFWCLWRKKWLYISLILASLPLSASIILIYSDRGITFNSLFGYIILFIAINEAFQRVKGTEETI